MQETRRARLQAVILEELSVLVRELKDPRVPLITFTRVEVTQDGSQATAYFTIFGTAAAADQEGFDEKKHREEAKACIEGLNSASGFLRKNLARALTVRHIPALVFREDRGFENALRVHELLKKMGPQQ